MENETTLISGNISSVIYQNPENGYTVLRLDTQEGVITAVGSIPNAAPGERVNLFGSWSRHPMHGEQFKAERAERFLPDSPAGIYEYLASGAVKGIGPVTARAMVEKFGAKTFEILENEPDEIAKLKGISVKKAAEISKAFKRQTEIRRLVEELSAYGLTAATALQLYRYYGEEAVEAFHDNPYIVAGFGESFAKADEIALQLGFEGDSPCRLEAAVLFELEHNLNNGHCFIPYKKLAEATGMLLDISSELIEDTIIGLAENGKIERETVAGVDACYLNEMYEAETYAAARIYEMARRGSDLPVNYTGAIEKAERQLGISFTEKQKEAVTCALQNRVVVLTGGPGTGKTTTIKAILTVFESLGFETALAAPTGRAAKRMSEISGREASTIHRLLEAGFAEGSERLIFKKNENDPLKADALILDECSMIDICLFRSVLAALTKNCHLILVGDADQLPPVGPGNAFSEIIRSGTVRTVFLSEIFRQGEGSRIVSSAHMINRGEMPEFTNKGDFFFLSRANEDRTASTIVELCAQRLPKNMNINPKDIQVLSPTRLYGTGTAALNKQLQAALNPPDKEKKEKRFGEFLFREGDRVMQIQNNYDIFWEKENERGEKEAGAGIFNGDIGQILRMDMSRQTAIIDFDDRVAEYSFEMLGELEPAYAITVHKAQGSEYKAVILAAMSGSASLLTRNILYTAVTRAKDILIIVGDENVIRKMVVNDRKQRRYSALRIRLSELAERGGKS